MMRMDLELDGGDGLWREHYNNDYYVGYWVKHNLVLSKC